MRPRSGFARVNSGEALVVLLVDGALCLVTSSLLKYAHVETSTHVHTVPIYTHKPSVPLLIKTWRCRNAYQNLERESARVRVKSPTPSGYVFFFSFFCELFAFFEGE